jgi:GNAT superfamily N-acetyltransferase
MTLIRPCTASDLPAIHSIVNAAAEAYRDVIPADQWHEPYMSMAHLEREVASRVAFVGLEEEGELTGVMGIQPVLDVDLIRHAYVLPSQQGRGVGTALLNHLQASASRRTLVGTWAAASWAIAFYRRNGFVQVPPPLATTLLTRYWSIPDSQVRTSVVLAKPSFDTSG